MKDSTTIKSLLGLTQEETGMLLGISRNQWALYTSGRRDIPSAALLRLADILSNLQKNKSVSEESKKIAKEEKKKELQWLQREYKTTTYKIQVLERQLTVMENIRQDCFAALEVVHYLESQPEKEPVTGLAQSVKIRVTHTLNKHSFQQLQELKLKKENLEMLKLKIEEKLKLPEIA